MHTRKGFIQSGEPFVWLTAAATALSLILILGLLGLILVNGLGFFWPRDVTLLTLTDGSQLLGQVMDRERIPQPNAGPGGERIQVKVGNRDVFGQDFRWVDVEEVREQTRPREAVVLERLEWGNLYGFIQEVRDGERVLARDEEAGWQALTPLIPKMQALRGRIKQLEHDEVGAINHAMKQDRLRIRRIRVEHPDLPEDARRRIEALQQAVQGREAAYQRLTEQIDGLYTQAQRYTVVMKLAGDQDKVVPVFQIVRACRPNALGAGGKAGVYLSRVWEFVSGDPREANTEGGVFPAIFGTVMMVFIMSLAVVPLGVLAALYLREYARQGTVVRLVRIAVNNLAGVPSIVFGVFGLGFFIYFVGGTMDRVFFPESLPEPTFGTGGILWASLTLALLTVPVVIVATEEGLAAVPREIREGSLSLGATRWETIRRIVLPAAAPAIMTGLILAMARAAGEVAPLMITGVVKLAPTLPMDGTFPYFHLDRKFMHLGFHIYDVGFQSPNVEAAQPMVYATTLLLIGVVILLNLSALWLRNRLRRRYRTSKV